MERAVNEFLKSDKAYIHHYDNTPMYILHFFHGCKKDNFQMKHCDIFFLFLVKFM